MTVFTLWEPDDEWPALLQAKAILWFADMNFGKPNLHVGKVGATLIPKWNVCVFGSFRMTKTFLNGKLQKL